MEHRAQKKLGVEPSLLGFGCMRFPTLEGGAIDEEQATAMLDRAREGGVNYFDTAYFYHNGKSENFVGRALARWPRDSYYLTSKLPTTLIHSLDDAKRIYAEQRERLQKDYLDFYLLHNLNGARWREMVDTGVVDWCLERQAAGDGLRGAVPPAAGPAGTLGEGGIHPMTREQLLDAVGDIRDAFIREAAPPPASYRKQREFPWTGAVAACLALMIVGSTFFLSQMNMGDGATGSGGASAVTEDTAEVGESGGTVNGAADGTDDSEPETAAITVTVDGTVYVQAGGVGRHPEACPEGFSYAGEAELPDTGELCPYYADPERPGQIYVYQSCWDEGTRTTYMAYVRYEAETTN